MAKAIKLELNIVSFANSVEEDKLNAFLENVDRYIDELDFLHWIFVGKYLNVAMY
jgi:hypothetical protein